ncbi:MAG TPA: 2-dehydropantoate 2-reductase [Candidatus Dormibacteraeota bacterium]|nr:2-dehydropantoate 2-reductase [Candidatus Dormibacteraeota bacterium]
MSSSMARENLNVAVLGPGGVGGLLGALLARIGNSVQVIAGEETTRAIAERGLRIESHRFGDFRVSVRTANRLEEAVNACFITVKSTQLQEALERVPADSLGTALVIPFLNGIDHIELLKAIYPPSSVVAATIRVEAARVEPGLIRHMSPFASVEIAASADNVGRVDLVAAQLKAAGLDVRVRDDETAMLWDKLVMLAPLALLTTHERANAGVIRTRRREDFIAVISEVAAVAQAEGAAVDPEAVVRLLDSAPETMESSMQRDQAARRPLELDAIGSAVVRHAAKTGVAVPVTRRLVEELQVRSKRPVSSR